jgi:hypothetical protein
MKGLPSKEIVMTEIKSLKGETFYITTTALRDTYYIYKIANNVATKLGSNKSPLVLEDKYIGEREKALKRLEKMIDEQ